MEGEVSTFIFSIYPFIAEESIPFIGEVGGIVFRVEQLVDDQAALFGDIGLFEGKQLIFSG